MRPHPQRIEIILDLLKGIQPKVIAFNRNAGLTTIFDIKKQFVELVPTLKKDLPDDDQLSLF